MAIFDTNCQNPLGLHVKANVDISVYNRCGGILAVGDVVQFDTNQVNAEVTSIAEGGSASVYSNVYVPVAIATGVAIGAGGFYGVVINGTIADNAMGKVRVQGVVVASVIAASGSIAIGDPLVIATASGAGVGGDLDLVEAAGEPYHATARGAATTPTTRTLIEVLFDGIGNFGTFVS